MDTTTSYSGHELKIERIRRRVRQYQLAEAMQPPIRPATVSNIERQEYPSPETVRRYLSALERCATSGAALPPGEEGAA